MERVRTTDAPVPVGCPVQSVKIKQKKERTVYIRLSSVCQETRFMHQARAGFLSYHVQKSTPASGKAPFKGFLPALTGRIGNHGRCFGKSFSRTAPNTNPLQIHACRRRYGSHGQTAACLLRCPPQRRQAVQILNPHHFNHTAGSVPGLPLYAWYMTPPLFYLIEIKKAQQ